jgi:small subunit ribosomal protein S16
MATVIRLARYGAKKRPYYHVVVTDSRNARNSGAILETVGKYNPMLARDDAKRVVLNTEKIKAWLAKGARASDRVYKFLANAGLVAAKPIPNQTKKNQPSEKTQMKAKDKAEKLAKIAEEKAAAEAAAKAAAEAPAETPAEETATESTAE